jgi:TetR/AcrR family transcriptional repressor of mexJK operon
VGPVTESRQERKRVAILEAAADVFLRNGYVGSSMDEVAAAAAVSKQTVYKHFADKEALFRELITTTVHATDDRGNGDVAVVGDRPLAVELRAFARHLLHGIMQPRVLQLRRLVIGEAVRFPELGRTFYQGGVSKTVNTLATDFHRLAEQGVLDVPDPHLAAEHFNWLVVSVPLNRAMLLGDDHGMSTDDLDKFADAGVDAFLAAYGSPRGATPHRETPDGIP